MKSAFFLAIYIFVVKNALADPCGGKGNKLITSEISRLLQGNTICTFDSQEQHWSNGELWDYKKGPDAPIDPTSRVGFWSVHDDQVHYIYDKLKFDYYIYFDGVRICFYDKTNTRDAFKIEGISKPCPGF